MAGANDRPQWLDTVLKLERAIGSRVEEAVTSDAYFEFVAHANRAQKRFFEAVEGVQQEWLHLFNLPAGTDVRRLREQISRMEREIEALTKELADRRESDGAGPRPRPRSNQRRQAQHRREK
jgi:hypothetical protein